MVLFYGLLSKKAFFCILGPDFPCSVIHRPNKGNDGSQAHVNFGIIQIKDFICKIARIRIGLLPLLKQTVLEMRRLLCTYINLLFR